MQITLGLSKCFNRRNVDEIATYDYSKFAHILDPEGNNTFFIFYNYQPMSQLLTAYCKRPTANYSLTAVTLDPSTPVVSNTKSLSVNFDTQKGNCRVVPSGRLSV